MKEFIKAILYTPLYNILMLLVFLTPGNNVGVAIIALTVLIRLVLVPSTNKSYQAQKEIKALQPKLDEIKANYSKEEQAQKTMELYKEHKVNPLGSCLPLLIQLPIIFVLYRVFQDGLNASRFDLLYSFIPHPTAVNTIFLGIDLARPEKIVLPLIVGLLQLVQMWQMQSYTMSPVKKTGNQQADMATMMTKQMMFLTPVMTFVIAFRLPAALPLYWGVTTLFTIVQQWWFFEKVGGAPPFYKKVAVILESGNSEKSIKSRIDEKKELVKPEKNDNMKKIKSKNKDVVVTVRRKGER